MDTQECSGCHMHINPFGFAFEVYDWAGAYRATENGAPIDTSFPLEFGSIEGDAMRRHEPRPAEDLALLGGVEDGRTRRPPHLQGHPSLADDEEGVGRLPLAEEVLPGPGVHVDRAARHQRQCVGVQAREERVVR